MEKNVVEEDQAGEDLQLTSIPEKKRKLTTPLLVLAGAAVVVLGVIISAFYFNQGSPVTNIDNPLGEGAALESAATPTPFPFQEMTIPYLRKREFNSRLGELTQIAENGSYTTYLTSYDSDGFRVNGLLTVPQEAKTAIFAPGKGFPAIVFVHGYIPPATYSTTERYVDHVDYLARNGFVVFKIDLRGHGDSEGEPGGGYYSADYVIDVLNARAALANYELVDAKRIGLWGHSMAGNVVARALASAPDIKAISIWGGAVYTYTDFSEYEIEDNSYQPPSADSPVRQKRNELFRMYGNFDPESEFWKQVPMTNYLDEINGAIQLNHALDDGVVAIGYSRNLAEILDKAGIEHELNEYPSGGHNISGASFTQAMQKTVDFFKSHL